MISTNQSTVTRRTPTNDSGPLYLEGLLPQSSLGSEPEEVCYRTLERMFHPVTAEQNFLGCKLIVKTVRAVLQE